MTEAQIKHMVDRFLGWKLPEDFTPDAGIKYAPPHGCWSTRPSGTNLLDALQADAMVRYLIEGMPASSADAPAGASEEGLRELIDLCNLETSVLHEHSKKANIVRDDFYRAARKCLPELIAEIRAIRRLFPSVDLLKAAKALLAAAEKHIFGDECKQERETMRAAIRSAEGDEG